MTRPEHRDLHRQLLAVLIALGLLAGGQGTGQEQESLDSTGEIVSYQVAGLKRKLLRETSSGDERLQSGALLTSGDVLRTGWFSAAEIVAMERASRFHLGPRTRVRLAHEIPGVLLELERGRLRALFDDLPGGETAAEAERIVTTPSVILAVRGTEYGVEVDGDGDTSIVVFSGTVEAVDRERSSPPVILEAGFTCSFRRGRWQEPRRHGMRSGDWDAGRSPDLGRHHGGTDPGGGQDTGMGPRAGRGGGSGRHGR